MTDQNEIALFPLRVVMFPGGKVDLQIFERRYLDLVSHCMRNDVGFGVCLLKEGEEVVRDNARQTIHRTGTYSKIVDWNQLDNGLLGITVEGQTKFRIQDCWQADTGVLQGKVEYTTGDSTSNDDVIPLDDDYGALVDLLQSLENHPLIEKRKLKINYDNLWDLGWRLSELIPLEVEQKQELLELDDPWDRIRSIEKLVADMANEA